MLTENNFLNKIKLSKIREIVNFCNYLTQNGKIIINLTNGEPEYNTEIQIKQAGINALLDGKTGYAPTYGVMELRKKISEYTNENRNLNISEENILITNGASHGIFLAIGSFINHNDEILLPNPGYTSYFDLAKYYGAKIKTYDLKPENYFRIKAEDIIKKITNKTKMIVINSPNNPTGSICEKKDCNIIYKFIRDKNIIILSDEVYSEIIYDSLNYYSYIECDKCLEKTILINSFSKTYAMAGWRLGYIVANSKYIDAMVKLNSLTTCGVNHFIQYAGIEAINLKNEIVKNIIKDYEMKRNYVYKKINQIDGLSCYKPSGAFYAFIDIRALGISSEEFVMDLIKKHGVALIPGSAFGSQGEGFVRMCFAKNINEIEKGCEEVGKYVESLCL